MVTLVANIHQTSFVVVASCSGSYNRCIDFSLVVALSTVIMSQRHTLQGDFFLFSNSFKYKLKQYNL
jgi:hypothetical protein